MPSYKHPCPQCDTFIERTVAACPACGFPDPFAPDAAQRAERKPAPTPPAAQAPAAVTAARACAGCGAALPPGARFCTECGTLAEA